MTEFQFMRPLFLIFLLIPFLGLGTFFSRRSGLGSWQKICHPVLLDYLLVRGSNIDTKKPRLLFLAALTLGLLAAAGPALKNAEQPVLQTQNPVMIVLNLSSDMLQTDVSPTRAERAKLEITDLLGKIQDADTGLIVYADEPFVLTPLSKDPNLIVNLLDAVQTDIMPSNGDRPDRALSLATERIKSAGFAQGEIVLITSEAGIDQALTQEAVLKARQSGIITNVIGIKSNATTELEQIAKTGGGLYISYADQAIGTLADRINHNAIEAVNESLDDTLIWHDYGYELMFLSILCFLLLFRYPLVTAVFLCFFGLTAYCEAGFWKSDEAMASDFFERGQYDQAAKHFQDSAWQGSALYRSGRYAEAADAFGKTQGLEALYNKGNALAKAGQIDEAVKAYEDVLKEQPDHEDARFNLDYLKQQQQNEQQQQNQNDQSDQNQDQNQSDDQQQNNDRQNEDQNEQNEQNEQNQENQAEDNQNKNSDQNKESPSDQNQDSEQDQNTENQDSEQDQDSKQNQTTQSQSKQEQTDSSQDGSSPENRQTTATLPKPEDKDDQKNQPQATPLSETKDNENPYDEEVQARAQRYRDIEEDRGGLLRAFIRKEYRKNRYRETQ